jgi:hypothetical protein
MKRTVLLITFCFALCIPFWGQQETAGGQQAEAPSATTKQRHELERWRYDPAAPKTSDTPCELKGLEKINPDDINYGSLLSIWHLGIVQETIRSLTWWAAVIEAIALFITLLYVYYLLAQRDRREIVAGDVLAQVWNSCLYAHTKATEAIDKYNAIVDEGNARHDRSLAAAAAEPTAAQPASATTQANDDASVLVVDKGANAEMQRPPESPLTRQMFEVPVGNSEAKAATNDTTRTAPAVPSRPSAAVFRNAPPTTAVPSKSTDRAPGRGTGYLSPVEICAAQVASKQQTDAPKETSAGSLTQSSKPSAEPASVDESVGTGVSEVARLRQQLEAKNQQINNLRRRIRTMNEKADTAENGSGAESPAQ